MISPTNYIQKSLDSETARFTTGPNTDSIETSTYSPYYIYRDKTNHNFQENFKVYYKLNLRDNDYNTISENLTTTDTSFIRSKDYTTPNADINNKISEIVTTEPSYLTEPQDTIMNYENLLTPDGYLFNFDTSNGMHVKETGQESNGSKVKGSYSYIGDDGKIYKISYTADENGFLAHGDHLPTPPPVSIETNEALKPHLFQNKSVVFDDGSYDEQKYGYRKNELNFNSNDVQITEQTALQPQAHGATTMSYLNEEDVSSTKLAKNVMSKGYEYFPPQGKKLIEIRQPVHKTSSKTDENNYAINLNNILSEPFDITDISTSL
ncbi:unnamed protein product [Leptidea sinapis]|uniref:Uncharacterized protein n=1 Tax=Leptidea sinapis TaxID=189913 RepID=A0A5E4QEQ8_9NEOP|nr:unnamed protein product [Leptidea sinapis]